MIAANGDRLLDVVDLRTVFPTEEGIVRAADGVDFAVDRGRTLALVGESGCGKTATALSILRLVPPPGRIADGRILFEGRDLLSLGARELRAIRGDRIAMIFQEPMTALNPIFTVGAQIVEAIRAHRRASRREARAAAIDLLARVGIGDAPRRFAEHPHRLSGGMRQRAMIAMALACRPSLLIADEPTTALDATVQAGVMDLLAELQSELRMAILLVTHDLGIVAGFADRVAVMYAGRIVEEAPCGELLEAPLHPYTRALMAAVPRLGAPRRARLPAIPGSVPDPLALPGGCPFHPRCSERRPECEEIGPPEVAPAPGRRVRCHLYPQAAGGSP